MTRHLSEEQLRAAIAKEGKRFEEIYLWVEEHMPPSFFKEVDSEDVFLLVHHLMGFNLNEYFSQIHCKQVSFTLCLDSPEMDVRVLKTYEQFVIKNYRTFISNAPPPFAGVTAHLRIVVVVLSHMQEKKPQSPPTLSQEVLAQLKLRNKEVSDSLIHAFLEQVSPLFLRSVTEERLTLALSMFFRAQTRDHCQYEVHYQENWKEKGSPSLQIVLAWRNVSKYNFIYRLAKVVYRHGLTMKRISATCINPYSTHNVLILSLGLHGSKGGAAWEEADIDDFLKELVTLKYFPGMEPIEKVFVDTHILTGNQGNLLKAIAYFVHQALVALDPNIYSLRHIEEGLCRHVDLIVQLISAFEYKFHPKKHDLNAYIQLRDQLVQKTNDLDTGNETQDTKRKNILKQSLHFLDFTLKTNYFCNNKTALSFRLNPQYLDVLAFERKDKFPEIPYAIFFLKGLHFIGFHVRFRDLSRGGLRTVTLKKKEQMIEERNLVFSECYNLAYTQNKKNKDIPEGGAKGVIFLEPDERLLAELAIYRRELENSGLAPEGVTHLIDSLEQEQQREHLYQSQRAYIENLLILLNCENDGTLRAKNIIDYWKKPEYLYLGPDENMHNSMIEWIAAYSIHRNYKPGGAFISSKPGAGINHKEYGVTSLGVNVYMEEGLKAIGIDPTKTSFTIKMSGGPDGDVAGNQLANLYCFYPKTAKLLALIDGSGTLFDPLGLNLHLLYDLFQEGKPLCHYPAQELGEGGFLLDTSKKFEQTAYTTQTLLQKKSKGVLVEEWLSGSEMNHLLRHTILKTKTDVFIPAGGRPRTLNDSNIKDFLDETGKPTSKLIVEGANLYLTPWARRSLEKLGTWIIKDSSANKGGVICSSLEVLFTLTLSSEEFFEHKKTIVAEILDMIRVKAKEEAQLLLTTRAQTSGYLTEISEWISERINLFKDQLLAHLQTVTLSSDPQDPLIQCLLSYCPPLLKEHYQKRILEELPDTHKKAIIACHLASRIVYRKGLQWAPSLPDVLPLIATDPTIVGSTTTP